MAILCKNRTTCDKRPLNLLWESEIDLLLHSAGTYRVYIAIHLNLGSFRKWLKILVITCSVYILRMKDIYLLYISQECMEWYGYLFTRPWIAFLPFSHFYPAAPSVSHPLAVLSSTFFSILVQVFSWIFRCFLFILCLPFSSSCFRFGGWAQSWLRFQSNMVGQWNMAQHGGRWTTRHRNSW